VPHRLRFSDLEPPEKPAVVEVPAYAVCQHCEFLRVFGASAGSLPPDHCPVCGREVNVHSGGERFPSAYVGRISRALHATPPLVKR
jgi:hypothetical protein